MIGGTTLFRIGLGAALAGSLYLGYQAIVSHHEEVGEARADARWQLKEKTREAAHATALAVETKKVTDAELSLNKFKTNQEITDARNKNTVAALSNRLGLATDELGRLRDPNANNGPATQGTADGSAFSGQGLGAKAGGLLSVQLSDLLSRLLREADEINGAYISCRADSASLRSVLAGAQ